MDLNPNAVTLTRSEYNEMKSMIRMLLLAAMSSGGKLRLWKKTLEMYEGDRIRDIEIDIMEDKQNYCVLFLAWDKTQPEKEPTCSQ